MSGFGGTALLNLEGYLQIPLPVVAAAPLSTHLDGYGIGPLPVKMTNSRQGVSLDAVTVPSVPVNLTTMAAISLDSYSIGPLPVAVSPAVGFGTAPLIVDFPEAARDSFDRIRVSDNHVLFSSQLNYDLQLLRWDQAVVGGGSVTHRPNESAAELRVGTGATDSAVRQTKRYFQYLAGQSLQVSMSFSDAYGQTNVTKRVGYFDANNGIFLQTSGASVSLVLRSSVSGSPSDANAVVQASWNLDKFDGTGPSGVNLDLTKANILMVDLQWLGVGRVRIGFYYGGKIHYAHQFINANVVSTVYMSRGGLPCRYEIANTAGTASAAFLKQICVGVTREGGEEEEGIMGCADTGFGVVSAGATQQSALTIRLRSPYNRAFLKPLVAYVSNSGIAGVRFQVILNPTLTGGALTWTQVDAAMEQSVTQLSYTAGTGQKLAVGYVPSTAGAKDSVSIPTSSVLGMAADIAGNTDTLAIVVDASTGTQAIQAALQVLELY